MTSKPTITLQDLAVLSEKAKETRPVRVPTAVAGVWRTDHLRDRDAVDAFKDALAEWYASGELQRLAELAEDGERYRDMRDNDRSLEYSDHTSNRLNGRPTDLTSAIDAAIKDQDHE